jgi:hypothetical protein
VPSMDWEAFQHDHHRPHLLIVSMTTVKGRRTAMMAKKDFERLAVRLGASGNYAFKAEGTNIHAAFENDADAARFAALLQIQQKTRELEWASKAWVRMDDAAYRRIAVILRKARR